MLRNQEAEKAPAYFETSSHPHSKGTLWKQFRHPGNNVLQTLLIYLTQQSERYTTPINSHKNTVYSVARCGAKE